MRLDLLGIVASATLLLITAGAAEACSRKVSAQAAQTIVPTNRINQDLLDRAVRAEVNYHRCRAGLSAVGNAGNSLATVARGHSQWMANRQILSHRSTVPGKASLSQRIRAARVDFRTGSENIGMVHRYQIDNRRFRILDSQSCEFATYDGQPLPAHSYASLARHMVNLWMESPGHRKNILDRRVNRTSVAVAFDQSAQYCGRYWVTQKFVG